MFQIGFGLNRLGSAERWWPAGVEAFWDFAENRYFGRDVVVSRASEGLAVNGSEAYESFAADELRRTDLGVLIEPQATNVLANNSMSGAATGSSGTLPTGWSRFTGGGLATEIVGLGTDMGLPFIDVRYFGTTSALSGSNIQFQVPGPAASVGQEWMFSAFVAVVGGSTAGLNLVRFLQREYDAGGGQIYIHYGDDLADSFTGELYRFSQSFSMTQPNADQVRPVLELTYDGGQEIDITLRIAAPQLEQGSEASSPILTESGAATRDADLVEVELPSGDQAVTITFGDGSADVIGGQNGTFIVPANLGQPLIRSIASEPE